MLERKIASIGDRAHNHQVMSPKRSLQPPGWGLWLCLLTPVLVQLFFPKPSTTFPTCFCRGERRKYAGKKVRLNRGLNSQPPGHESNTLTTKPPGRGENGRNMLVFVPNNSEEIVDIRRKYTVTARNKSK